MNKKKTFNEYLLNNKYRGYFLVDKLKRLRQFLKEISKLIILQKLAHKTKQLA
ncbi:hypothetical protein HYD72_00845 [Mycoplasmopsis bovis]|nr:hypothetical protein [Mycoplasmopsis bovis]QQH49235.1 hypothetical protein HYD72_00845 [Mycoplasmopsis bovis]